MTKIAVIGAGSWGTALAQTLVLNNFEVCVRALVWEQGCLEEVAQELFNRPLTTEFRGLSALENK